LLVTCLRFWRNCDAHTYLYNFVYAGKVAPGIFRYFYSAFMAY
jgi:hypothetical protein